MSADPSFQGRVFEPTSTYVVVREHVRETVHMLGAYSQILAHAVEEGRCAIVGAQYSLSEGRVHLVETLGDIG